VPSSEHPLPPPSPQLPSSRRSSFFAASGLLPSAERIVPVLVEMEYHPFVLSAVIPASDILARHLYLEQKAKPTVRGVVMVMVGGWQFAGWSAHVFRVSSRVIIHVAAAAALQEVIINNPESHDPTDGAAR